MRTNWPINVNISGTVGLGVTTCGACATAGPPQSERASKRTPNSVRRSLLILFPPGVPTGLDYMPGPGAGIVPKWARTCTHGRSLDATRGMFSDCLLGPVPYSGARGFERTAMRLGGRPAVLMACLTLVLGAAALFGAGQTPAPAGKTAAPAAKKASPAPKAPAPAAAAAASIDGIWPREIKTSIGTVTIYQPQVDTWDGIQIEFRLAVSVQASAEIGRASC